MQPGGQWNGAISVHFMGTGTGQVDADLTDCKAPRALDVNASSVDDDDRAVDWRKQGQRGTRPGNMLWGYGIDEWNDDLLTFFPLIFCSISDTTATAPAAATAASLGATGYKADATATTATPAPAAT